MLATIQFRTYLTHTRFIVGSAIQSARVIQTLFLGNRLLIGSPAVCFVVFYKLPVKYNINTITYVKKKEKEDEQKKIKLLIVSMHF